MRNGYKITQNSFRGYSTILRRGDSINSENGIKYHEYVLVYPLLLLNYHGSNEKDIMSQMETTVEGHIAYNSCNRNLHKEPVDLTLFLKAADILEPLTPTPMIDHMLQSIYCNLCVDAMRKQDFATALANARKSVSKGEKLSQTGANSPVSIDRKLFSEFLLSIHDCLIHADRCVVEATEKLIDLKLINGGTEMSKNRNSLVRLARDGDHHARAILIFLPPNADSVLTENGD